jgi:hypothetical protein
MLPPENQKPPSAGATVDKSGKTIVVDPNVAIRPKEIGPYARLNQASLEFIKLLEPHAFIVVSFQILSFIFISGWTFIQFIHQEGGFMTYIVATIILLTFLFCFYLDWQRVKNGKNLILFWRPWISWNKIVGTDPLYLLNCPAWQT